MRRFPHDRARRVALLLFVVGVVATLGACRDPLRIPRIEPSLNGWQQPYSGEPGLRVHVFDTGTLTLVEAVTYAGGSWSAPESLEALAFVIEHPLHGLIVFDTGLSTRVRTDPESYVGWLGARLELFDIAEGQDLPTQMRAAGLKPEQVTRVVLSHLHFDHTGSVEAFPAATVVRAARERAHGKPDSWLPDFVVPEDFDGVQHWQEIDYEELPPLATFLAHLDLLGDGSLLAVDLSGHTAGSQGLLVRTPRQPVLLTGDAVYVDKSWRFAARPIFAESPRLWWEQIWRIKKFAQLEPSLIVLPAHDVDASRRARFDSLVVHDFEPDEAD